MTDNEEYLEWAYDRECDEFLDNLNDNIMDMIAGYDRLSVRKKLLKLNNK